MTEWRDNWESNGWKNSKGKPVVNRDLVELATELEDMLRQQGKVRYRWVPREENEAADTECNRRMDMELADRNTGLLAY